jgi:hypothetical protein
VIAGRLVFYALTPDTHGGRRVGGDAVATARPDVLDRRGEVLAQRHLTLKPLEARQFDALDRLPARPIELVPPGTADPIGALVEIFADTEALTGSLPDGGAKPNE